MSFYKSSSIQKLKEKKESKKSEHHIGKKCERCIEL